MDRLNYKGKEIIGIDQGFGNMKTRHIVFKSGIKEYEEKPAFGEDILEYNGKYYVFGEGHKSFISDKVMDEDYYILTLAALAKELNVRGIQKADVILAVGLPIQWIATQRAAFKEYLLRNERVSFKHKDVKYEVHICGADVFPQGYAGIITEISQFQGVNVLADIGNGTMNILYINNGKPDSSRCYTEKLGVYQCINQMNNTILTKCGSTLNEEIIEEFLRYGTANVSQRFEQEMKNVAMEYAEQIFLKLREYEYNPELMTLHIIGGGGRIIQNFGTYDANRVEIITDICATAKGYELLELAVLKKADRIGA